MEDERKQGTEDELLDDFPNGSEEKTDNGEETAKERPAPEPEKRQSAEEDEPLRIQLIRLQADFDNYRKRTEAERMQRAKYALEPVLPGILDALDDIERALAHKDHETGEWKKGMEMIHKKLLEYLKSNGLKPIESVGMPFDPCYHEAVSVQPADVEREMVAAEMLRGYMLHDRVIRHARVLVAAPMEDTIQDNSEGDDNSEANEEDGGCGCGDANHSDDARDARGKIAKEE
ncbi:MAG: nucleotide exchange factor GrpE, partial [Candidatus Thermoplasmatota archaeon]|nr:nucleotide exchange factor GrpE [Candidatus Thermoplasmatota archaeon]